MKCCTDLFLVSQFTIGGNIQSAPKPDFSKSMKTEPAKKFYNSFVNRVRELHKKGQVADGIFGAMMKVCIVNDG
jgi:D-tyrosyl-tRNA(Tyr) deacylase